MTATLFSFAVFNFVAESILELILLISSCTVVVFLSVSSSFNLAWVADIDSFSASKVDFNKTFFFSFSIFFLSNPFIAESHVNFAQLAVKFADAPIIDGKAPSVPNAAPEPKVAAVPKAITDPTKIIPVNAVAASSYIHARFSFCIAAVLFIDSSAKFFIAAVFAFERSVFFSHTSLNNLAVSSCNFAPNSIVSSFRSTCMWVRSLTSLFIFPKRSLRLNADDSSDKCLPVLC